MKGLRECITTLRSVQTEESAANTLFLPCWTLRTSQLWRQCCFRVLALKVLFVSFRVRHLWLNSKDNLLRNHTFQIFRLQNLLAVFITLNKISYLSLSTGIHVGSQHETLTPYVRLITSFTHRSDLERISPYIITSISSRQVMRIVIISWSNAKFSEPSP